MEHRIDYTKVAPGALQAMLGLGKYLARAAWSGSCSTWST